MINLGEFSDLQLLAELITRNNIGTSPVKRTYCTPHPDTCAAIDKDHVATLTLDEDTVTELCRLLNEERLNRGIINGCT